jgi:hypothetical protein
VHHVIEAFTGQGRDSNTGVLARQAGRVVSEVEDVHDARQVVHAELADEDEVGEQRP